MEMGKRSLRVWILILGRREGQGRTSRSLISVGENNRRCQLGDCARDLVLRLISNVPPQLCAHNITATRSITMWGLDRLSASSTPSGTPPPRRDSYSPAPRRGYPASGPGPLPIRPGLQPRSSSLSLASASNSTTSLPGTARIPNGGSRRQPTRGASHRGPDPVQILASIMGGLPRKPLTGDDEKTGAVPQKPEEVIEHVDFGGLSLQDFAAEAPKVQQPSTSIHTYSAQSVEECTCLYFVFSDFCSS
jgi:hypothetical protein